MEWTVMFEARDIARAFGELPDLRERMLECGVIGKPDVPFLTAERCVVYAKAA
jgi:hypothetical protein